MSSSQLSRPTSRTEALLRLRDITELAELFLDGAQQQFLALPRANREATSRACEATNAAIRSSRAYLNDLSAVNAATAGEWIYRAAASWTLAKNRMVLRQQAAAEVWLKILAIWADSLEVALAFRPETPEGKGPNEAR
jgi:hypothetical protein